MNAESASKRAWSLQTAVGHASNQPCIQLHKFPFEVGRSGSRDLVVHCPHVSKMHAVFLLHQGILYLEDQGSTNGTFVNGRRHVGRRQVHADDIIQFGSHEYRLSKVEHSLLETMSLGQLPLISNMVEFRHIIKNRAIIPSFQSVVGITSGDPIGYEVLVRSSHEGLRGAAELFLAATRTGMASELSELSRSEGMSKGRVLPDNSIRFLNTHPAEIADNNLLPSLERLRIANPATRIVLEIHESSICNPQSMKQLAKELRTLDIGVAYDDFGQGQSRIMELIEAPSDYLKFDMELIRGIDKAPRARQHLLASLVQMARDIGIKTVAEGVETAEELDVCVELGFDLAQGYFFSKPSPIEWIVAETVNLEFNDRLLKRKTNSSLHTIEI